MINDKSTLLLGYKREEKRTPTPLPLLLASHL